MDTEKWLLTGYYAEIFSIPSEADTGMALSVKKQKVYLEETVSTAEGKSRTDKKESKSCILLVMADKSIVII